MLSACCLNVIPLSNVTPRILVLCVTGRGVLFSVMCGCILYSALWGAMSVRKDLFVENSILLFVSHCSSVWMLSYSCVAAVSSFGCCEVVCVWHGVSVWFGGSGYAVHELVEQCGWEDRALRNSVCVVFWRCLWVSWLLPYGRHNAGFWRLMRVEVSILEWESDWKMIVYWRCVHTDHPQ